MVQECCACDTRRDDDGDEGYEDCAGDWWCDVHIELGMEWEREHCMNEDHDHDETKPEEEEEEKDQLTLLQEEAEKLTTKTTIIEPDGSTRPVKERLTLTTVQKILNCQKYHYVRLNVPSGRKDLVWADTEGRPRNPIATQYLAIFGAHPANKDNIENVVNGTAILWEASE